MRKIESDMKSGKSLIIMETSALSVELNVILLIHSTLTDSLHLHAFVLFLYSFVLILKPHRPSGSYKT